MSPMTLLRAMVVLAVVYANVVAMIFVGIAVARKKPPKRAAYLALEAVLLAALCVSAGMFSIYLAPGYRGKAFDCHFDKPLTTAVGACAFSFRGIAP